MLVVGQRFSAWLTFEEVAGNRGGDPEAQVLHALARPLPRWQGQTSPHPVALEVDGGTLYWDSPRDVTGPVQLTGTIAFNNVDAPDGLPLTTGVLRRIRMEWRPTHGTIGRAQYDDVDRSYLPSWEDPPPAAAASTSPVRLRWSGCLVDIDLAGSEDWG